MASLGLHCGARACLVTMLGLLVAGVGAGSVVEAGRLELQHVDLVLPQAHGILVLQPGIEPTSPVSEGRFSTTESPGKSPWLAFNLCFLYARHCASYSKALFYFTLITSSFLGSAG